MSLSVPVYLDLLSLEGWDTMVPEKHRNQGLYVWMHLTGNSSKTSRKSMPHRGNEFKEQMCILWSSPQPSQDMLRVKLKVNRRFRRNKTLAKTEIPMRYLFSKLQSSNQQSGLTQIHFSSSCILHLRASTFEPSFSDTASGSRVEEHASDVGKSEEKPAKATHSTRMGFEDFLDSEQ
mgnify:CR=1 FL=1